MNHGNISIFVPHLGCPHRCSFCDQNTITKQDDTPSYEEISSAIEAAKSKCNYSAYDTQLAFFGGSFTAIEQNIMLNLLDIGYSFVKNGDIKSIRISTRPDYINEETLTILKTHGVESIELGAQSMDDEVLRLNNRGHNSRDVFKASKMIKNYGFELGLQMMTGLLGDNEEKSIYTAKKIAECDPDTVRIYPTLCLKNTRLGYLYQKGEYAPQSLQDAIKLCTRLLEFFNNKNINVIRLGLHDVKKDRLLSGPWHPAFSELCYNELYYNKILSQLKRAGSYIIYVNDHCISKATGQKRSNITKLSNQGYTCKIIGDASLCEGEIRVINV